MKKLVKLAVVSALTLSATSAFATNGSVMIGMGAKGRGMGGVGIGVSHGAESTLSNPAMIVPVEGIQVSFGGTLFMPDVSVNNTMYNPVAGSAFSSGEADSDADMFVIPSVSIANKVNDSFYWGVGMWGTGGLGVDYRETPSIAAGGSDMKMVTALQLMQFGVPLVYVKDSFSIGFTPLIQYASLDINYEHPTDMLNRGAGVSDDLSIGFNIGLGYTVSDFTFGAVYISEIEMKFEDVLENTISPFVNPSIAPNGYSNEKLSSPEQYGLGISYKNSGHTIAVDYRYINWEDAETYKDFGWEDQDIIAVGYEYANDNWAIRCGYQYAESAVQEQAVAFNSMMQETNYNSAGISAGTINTFNALGFPGNAETHITMGGTYAFNDKISIDLAAAHALEADDTFTNFVGQDIKVEHSETSFSFQVNYNF